MHNSKLFTILLLILAAIFMVTATSCFGNNSADNRPTSISSGMVVPQPQVESVLATTNGTHLAYYTTLDIKVKNNGAEGVILVQASVTQDGNTSQNEMPVYLKQGEEQELKLTFPLVWKGGDFTCKVQAVLPASTSSAFSNLPSGTVTSTPATYTPNITSLFTSQTISQGPGLQTAVYTFSPTYSGYINISGTSSSSTGYILLINNSTGVSNTYPFTTGTAISAPLISGNNYWIYWGNRDTSGIITATLTGTYSNTSSISFINTLFSSQTVSQGPSLQTMVYSFTPTYSGYMSISGTSSSSTGYIIIINTNTGASNTYNFGLGTTINFQLNSGYTYAIYFSNHDTSGNISATLSGIYSNSPLPSVSSQSSLFSSQTFSLSPGTQTVIYTFTPGYNGNILISGTSYSSTGYIMVLNNSSGASNTYNFGTTNTIVAPLTAANNYGIYFGNHDSSGIITATLTGIYQQ